MGVCTKERKGVTAEVLMATPCTNSLVAFGARTISFFKRKKDVSSAWNWRQPFLGANDSVGEERVGIGLGEP